MRKEVTIRNGETISYHEKGNGNNTVILLHGNLSNSTFFKTFIDKFDNDYRLIAPDLRGSGNSSYYRKISSINDFANDLRYFIEELNLENITLLGFASGGSIAMELAASNSVSLERLILVNSTSHRGFPIFKKNERNESILGEIYQTPEEMKNDPRDIRPTLELVNKENEELLKKTFVENYLKDKNVSLEILNLLIKEAQKQKNMLELFWSLANHNMSHKHNYYNIGTNNINNIIIPVLHIWNKENSIVPEYMSLANYEALKQNSKYVRYNDRSHFSLIEPTENLIKDIKSFIEN